MPAINDFYEAWVYISDHPYFKHPEYGRMMAAFPASLYVEVVKVHPGTMHIEEDPAENTLTQVWIECGGWLYAEDSQKYEMSHDPILDSGGNTFEDGIIELANILKYQVEHV